MILGCVDPIGEAGGDVAKSAAVAAGFPHTVPGMQVNRYCASGLDAVNFASRRGRRAGDHELVIAGGVESMSRVGIGASGGAWPVDPHRRHPRLFHAAGRLGRPDRHQVRLQPHRRRRLTPSRARSARRTPGAAGTSTGPWFRSATSTACRSSSRDEHMRPDTTMQGLGALNPSFTMYGETGRVRCGRGAGAPGGRGGGARPHRRQLLRHRRRRRRGADRLEARGQEGRPQAARRRSGPTPISARSRR